MSDKAEKILNDKDIRPTPVRLMVLRILLEEENPISVQEVEDRLGTVDRSSIWRALTLFADNHLLHILEDGSGSTKYEFCHAGEASEEDDDQHVHFRCEKCGKTFCLHDVPLPEVSLPEGFEGKRWNYVVSGLCPSCRRV